MKGLRPDGDERWEMPKLDGINLDRLAVLTETLGLLHPVTFDKERSACETLVILGAKTESMDHRLCFALEQGVRCEELVIVAGVRALADDEKKILRDAGVEAEGKTEADAARFLLDKHKIEGTVVSTANKADGKRATTEETISALIATRPYPDRPMVFVSHMPFMLRQWMTVLRALKTAESSAQVTMLGAPKLKPLSELPATFFDEACRTLFELGQLPPELLAD